MRWNILILSLFIILTSTSTYAAVYKWTDKDGNTHYSQKKPTDAQVERMKIAPPPRKDASTYKKPSLGKKDGSDKQSSEQADNESSPTEKKKLAEKQDSDCKAAKSTLKTLLSRGRVRLQDKEGNISYMSDEQKQQRIKREQDFVNKSCK